MFIPLEEEGVEGKGKISKLGIADYSKINDDNHALFYHIYVHCKGERREKRKGVQGWNCSLFK